MNTLREVFFLTNLAFLIAHELDAIHRHEWRFFFARIPVTDQTAYRLFITLHIPLFIYVIWNAHLSRFQIGVDIFLIVHAGLHWALRNHALLKFNNNFSRLWIFGGALLGIIHIGLLAFMP